VPLCAAIAAEESRANAHDKLVEALRETTDLLEAWWKSAGSPPHATELALNDAREAGAVSRPRGELSLHEQRQFKCQHVLEELDPAKENGFRYHCQKCGKYMLKLNGVLKRRLEAK
jgi:hypothetical protein